MWSQHAKKKIKIPVNKQKVLIIHVVYMWHMYKELIWYAACVVVNLSGVEQKSPNTNVVFIL